MLGVISMVALHESGLSLDSAQQQKMTHRVEGIFKAHEKLADSVKYLQMMLGV
jgi:hypothetical protein